MNLCCYFHPSCLTAKKPSHTLFWGPNPISVRCNWVRKGCNFKPIDVFKITVSADENKAIISAAEVANYIVCPESWRLKLIHKTRKASDIKELEGKRQRSSWLSDQSFSAELRQYAIVAYILLCLVVIAVFVSDQNASSKFRRSIQDSVHRLEKELKSK